LYPASVRTKLSLLAGALLASTLWLAGCGGGGSDDDPGPNPSAHAVRVSGDTPVPTGCTGGSTTGTVYANAEVEPSLARHPTNPNVLIAAWQQDRWNAGGARAVVTAASSDGGQTWQRTLQPMSRCGGGTAANGGNWERVTDPWIEFGPGGMAYFMALAFNGQSLQAGSSNAMLVSRSLDGGATWGPIQTLVQDGETRFNDKNTLTADPTDASLVYATWDRLDRTGHGPTLLARSTDGGATWEAAREIHAPTSAGVSQTIGNRIVVITDGPQRGTLLNVFTQIDTVNDVDSARVALIRSTDHGATWSAPIFVAELRAVGARDPTTGQVIRDGATLPSVAVGPGASVWVAWQDARFSGGVRDAIALSRSTDGGLTWSLPVAINQAAEVPAFTPTLAVRADGTLGVMHYDLRSDTADASTLLADVWLLTTTDGTTWRERRVAGPFDMALAPNAGGLFLGDYFAMVSEADRFLPLFVTALLTPSNRTDVFLRSIDDATAAGREAPSWLGRSGLGGEAAEAQFERRRQEAIVEAMEGRIPGWKAMRAASRRTR
jgi:hypothetical protein